MKWARDEVVNKEKLLIIGWGKTYIYVIYRLGGPYREKL